MGDRTNITDARQHDAEQAAGVIEQAMRNEGLIDKDVRLMGEIIAEALDAAGFDVVLRADPDTSDELAAEARRLLDAATTAPRSHRCPDGMVDDVISWACQHCGEWQRDYGPQTDCAAAPEPTMVHAPSRLIAALLAERDADVSPEAIARTVAMSHIAAERDAERAAREAAEAEARQLRELCGYFIDACAKHRISVPFHSSLQGLLADIAAGGVAAVTEGTEDR